MAVNFFLPGAQGGQGVNIGLGVNERGKLDWSVGLRQFYGHGNGAAGTFGANEVGFGSRGGLYAGGTQTNYNPWGAENRTWGANQLGSAQSYTAADVFGNYQNDRYAQNVFGGYSEGHTRGNNWGVSNSEYRGNVWGGPQFQHHSHANAFGGGGSWGGVSVPHYGHNHYHGCGGHQVGGWFGGGCF